MEKSSILPILTVSDFIALVNQTFDYAYPSVEIEGEVVSFKVSQDKYVFFDLKDDDGSINCFMTIWQLRMPIQDGMKVVISASPKLTQWGKFSLTVRSIKPSGEGSIKKSYELLKAKLDKEGLFSPDRKRNLPFAPKRIGVISSTQSAGYADFIKIINERWGGVRVDVAHVQVQGEGSADQIIKAIEYFNQQSELLEVLVVVRGGGSADDLSVFNDEQLVRAIAGSRIPTIVGIGHETDETLAELVADVRASTPSNAGQIVVPDKFETIRSLQFRVGSVLPKIIQSIELKKRSMADDLNFVFDKINRTLNDNLQVIESKKMLLSELNPGTVLKRGYAILRGRSVVGEVIEIETSEKIIKAEVKNVIKK